MQLEPAAEPERGGQAAGRPSGTGEPGRGAQPRRTLCRRVAAFLVRHRRCGPLAAWWDRFFLWFIRQMGYRLPDPLPPRAYRQARGVRYMVLLCLVCFGVAVADQAFCVLKGWLLLLRGISPDCQALRQWLMGYCIALTMLPFWMPRPLSSSRFGIAGPLIIWWAVNGNLIRTRLPAECRASSPTLWSFVDEVFVSSFITCGCMILGAVVFLCIRQRVGRIHRVWGTHGPATQDVINSILAEPAVEAAPGTECTICLDEGSASSRWRLLRCGHRFHETCLLEWLRRGRRCPLCRMDLHAAYLLTDERQEVEAGAAEV